VAALAACAAGLAAAAPPAISGAWVRATPPGAKTGAAYLTISTDGTADTLLAATSPAARTVELHTHVSDNGLSRMQRLDAVPLPAGESVHFEPGGLHLMLIDITAPLIAGQQVTLSLQFAKAGVVEVTAPVLDARAAAPAAPAAH
jgi:copper(I)-binding protein